MAHEDNYYEQYQWSPNFISLCRNEISDRTWIITMLENI